MLTSAQAYSGYCMQCWTSLIHARFGTAGVRHKGGTPLFPRTLPGLTTGSFPLHTASTTAPRPLPGVRGLCPGGQDVVQDAGLANVRIRDESQLMHRQRKLRPRTRRRGVTTEQKSPGLARLRGVLCALRRFACGHRQQR